MDEKTVIAGTNIETAIKNDLTWAQKHERLLIVVAVLIVILWLGNKWIDHSANVADHNAAVAKQQLDEQISVNKDLAHQAQQSAEQYSQIVSTVTQQNAALLKQMATRDTTLKGQQTTNATAPLPNVLNRWQDLAALKSGDLTASPAGTVVSDSAVRSTVNQLETVPVLTADLKDEHGVADNLQKQLTGANTVISDGNKQINGLNAQIIDQGKSCKADVKKVKDDARKSKRNWFLRGAAAGGAVALYIAVHYL